jgi:hypothetical protein
VFLRANPKGLWEAGLNPPPPARGDLQCDIIVRTAKDASLLANGKELAKLAGVAIPPGSAGPPTVKLGNVIARQNPANSQMIDFSFECEFSGARPASNTIWFEAEFSDMVFGERKTAQLTLRVGNNIKPRETIVCSVQNPLPNSSLCNVYASDRQAGKGNLAKAEGVKIEPAEARPKAEVGLYDVRVERHEKIPNLCKISLEVKGKGAPNDTLYQCAVVFRVKGAKQTVDFGNHFLGKVLPDGVKLQGDAVTIPPGADATCEIIVREVLNRNAPPIGMLANVEVMGGVVVAGDKLVVLSNVRVSKVDDFKVHVQFNYEFTKPPDPKKWYTMMVERGDIKLKPGSTGRICFQMRGDQVQMKGEVNQRIGGPPGWGTAKSYKLWAASGENQLDAVIKESLIRTVKVSEEAPPAAKEPIQITSAAVTSLGKNGTRIDYAYKFNGDAKPNPKSMYVTYYSVKGDTPSPFYHELGLNFKAENSYSRNVPVLILTNETEIEIWIYDSVQRQIVSNKMKLDLKKK